MDETTSEKRNWRVALLKAAVWLGPLAAALSSVAIRWSFLRLDSPLPLATLVWIYLMAFGGSIAASVFAGTVVPGRGPYRPLLHAVFSAFAYPLFLVALSAMIIGRAD